MHYIDKFVDFSEVRPDARIKLTKILDYYQDVVIRESASTSVGAKALRDRGICWVLSSWQVVVNRYPMMDEKVLVGTAPYEFKGFMGSRNFMMKTEEGEILSYANSLWSLVDIENMTLLRIPQDIIEAYVLEEKLDMEYAPRKIKLPDQMLQGDPIIAAYHHIDINNHVNNAQYVAMAEDLAPEGRSARQVRVEYRASAQYGDAITPYTYADKENGIYTVSLANGEAKPYAIVEFTI